MQPDHNRDPWEHRDNESTAGQHGVPEWTALLPMGVVAFGAGKQPVERLLALQGALARGVGLIVSIPALPSILGRMRVRLVRVLHAVDRVRRPLTAPDP